MSNSAQAARVARNAAAMPCCLPDALHLAVYIAVDTAALPYPVPEAGWPGGPRMRRAGDVAWLGRLRSLAAAGAAGQSGAGGACAPTGCKRWANASAGARDRSPPPSTQPRSQLGSMCETFKVRACGGRGVWVRRRCWPPPPSPLHRRSPHRRTTQRHARSDNAAAAEAARAAYAAAGGQPQLWMLNSLLSMYARRREPERAWRLFAATQAAADAAASEGPHPGSKAVLQPDGYSYAAVLNALSKARAHIGAASGPAQPHSLQRRRVHRTPTLPPTLSPACRRSRSTRPTTWRPRWHSVHSVCLTTCSRAASPPLSTASMR